MNINGHPIESLMNCTMENLKDMIDVNTVIGDTVETKDGTCIIPISKVSVGFASGGSEFGTDRISHEKDKRYPFGGGSGAGVSVKPVAFLVIREGSVRLLPVESNNTYDKIIDTIPQIIEILKNKISQTTDSSSSTSNN